MSNILTMTSTEISSMNGAFIFINLWSLGFSVTSFWKTGIALFRKLKHCSLELIIPSKLNIFFISKCKSTFSYISEIM